MNNKNAKKPSFNKIKSSKKRLVFAFLFLISLLMLLISPKETFIKTTVKKLFSGNNPVSSVEITTDDYDNEGSIKLTKEAHWISKTEAELNLSLETVRKTGDNKKDIVLVFDVSGSMEGEKLEKVKEDASELINYVLDKEEDNKVGLITFASESRIISPLTNNKENLLETINNLSTEDSTNYYLAYKSIEEILADYNKETGKDLVVLFMTDGSPTENAGATKGVYESLKEQHPYMTLNSIEYEKGKSTSDTQDISDGQWVADMNTLNNILFEATVSPEPYEKLKIIDYIDNEYFEIETNTPSKGNVVVDNNKITWRFTSNSYITGSEETLKVRLNLKEQYQNIKGLYPTNKKTEIEYKIEGEKEKTSTLTPILKNNYDVIYDINTPENCTLEDPEGENHFIYDTVTIKNIEPKCTGYQLKGWQIEERDVKYKSEDKFIMPEEDVHIRAIWSRQTMKAYMDGTVHEKTTLYKEIASQAEKYDYLKEYTGEHQDSLTVPGTEKIYYFNGNVTTNNVIFAGFCWKIVRTTDTGGVKLLYNGLLSNSGSCENTGANSRIGTSPFNSNWNSKSYVGYMHNKNYNVGELSLNPATTLFSNLSFNKTQYFSKYYNYNQSAANKYMLSDNPETTEDDIFTAEECIAAGNCNEVLVGTYTFLSTNRNYSNAIIRYVVGVSGEKIYFLNLNSGQILEDINSTYYIGDSFINNNGLYSITSENENIEFNKAEWFSKYSSANKKYVCIGQNPCENPLYITSSSSTTYNSEQIKKNNIYANDFDYVLNEETGEYEYVLKDTDKSNKMQFWDWKANYNNLSKNHYTCGNPEGKCSSIYYLFKTYDTYAEYISLTNGENISDAIQNMFYSDDVNKNNSSIKNVVDNWYENNMTNYTDFIEDTIFCNDRRIYNLAGWNPNGGATTGRLTFTSPINTYKCYNNTDKFMVSNEEAKLKYPVGLLTSAEVNLGNGAYLNNGNRWWLLTPATCSWNVRACVYNYNLNRISNDYDTYNWDVRPSISLKPEIEYTDGDGTVNNPYVIDTTE